MGTHNHNLRPSAAPRVRRTLEGERRNGRPRLSVHRSSKHIYAQVIDDATGTTIAAASTLEKDLQGVAQDGRRQGCRGGRRQAHRRARAEGRHQGGRVRPRRLPLSWARQGARRCRPRGRPEVLIERDLTVARGPQEERRRDRDRDREERESEFTDKLVHINRVAKVVKGGKRFGFAALVVVGDLQGPRRLRPRQGARGAGSDPQGDRSGAPQPRPRAAARRAARCITTATAVTAPARSCCARLLPAPASSPAAPMRAVFEMLGVQDVVAKSLGSTNPYNMVRATFDALKDQENPRGVAARRGKKVSRDRRAPP